VAQELKLQGVEYLAVANVAEAQTLREGGIRGPILCLGVARGEEIRLGLAYSVEFTISDYPSLLELLEAAQDTKGPVRVHIKVDVGMGRLGCLPEEALALGKKVQGSPPLKLQGLFTHFPAADNGQEEPTSAQLESFLGVKEQFEQAGLRPTLLHSANSGAIFDFPKSHLDMVRPGIALYGYPPSPELKNLPSLKPVMELVTRFALVKTLPKGHGISYGSTYVTQRETRIGVVPVGYGDGYPRMLSNTGKVKVGGEYFPIAGRVCMDQFMLDLEDRALGPETEVCLFGPEGPGADELAHMVGTICYEIITGITSRVTRVYLDKTEA
jgi:alanine racemase